MSVSLKKMALIGASILLGVIVGAVITGTKLKDSIGNELCYLPQPLMTLKTGARTCYGYRMRDYIDRPRNLQGLLDGTVEVDGEAGLLWLCDDGSVTPNPIRP